MERSTLFLLIVIAAVMLWAVFGPRLPVPYRLRSCQGVGWRRAFPEVPKQEIREFLGLFVAAFAFRDRDKLKLNPNDQIIDIYRALYPHKWQADSLELETLGGDLAKKYGISLEGIWNDRLTLGELFVRARTQAASL